MKSFKISTVGWVLAGLMAVFSAGTQESQGQGVYPELNCPATLQIPIDGALSHITTPPVFDVATDLLPLIEVCAEGVVGPFTQAQVIRFTEPNFQGSGVGPASGNSIQFSQAAQNFSLITPVECFMNDTAGYIVEFQPAVGAPVQYFAEITFEGVYQAPTANDDSFTVEKNTSNNQLDVLDNDVVLWACFPGSSIVIDTQPANGTAVVVGSGETAYIAYTPDPDWCGSDDPFTYHVEQGALVSLPATVHVEVTQANTHVPVANDDIDVWSVNRDEVLTVAAPGVLWNDTDDDSSVECGPVTLTVCNVTPPTVGTLDILPDGSFEYTPPAGYCGPVEFFYSACDADFQSEQARVAFTVVDENNCPYRDFAKTPDYHFLASGKWSEISNDETQQSVSFTREELLAFFTDVDMDDPYGCGNTVIWWNIGSIPGDDAPALGVDVTIVGADGSMVVEWNWKEVFESNPWGGDIDAFFGQDCPPSFCFESNDVPWLTFYAEQEGCPVVEDENRCDMYLDVQVGNDEWDVPPPAPAIDWPSLSEPITPWPYFGLPPVVEDSVDNLIPTLAILVPAYQANPNNCCDDLAWEIVGGLPKVLCQTDDFMENLYIDFWPTGTTFIVNIEGVDQEFEGAGETVTTLMGGTASLGGEYIRYTPPTNWPVCESDYDYIPYRIAQLNTYACGELDLTADPTYAYGYIKVHVEGACDETVAEDDHVVVCEGERTVIPVATLVANDYDNDFSKPQIVQFAGGSGVAKFGTNPPPAKVGRFGALNGPYTLEPFAVEFQEAFVDGDSTDVIEGDTCEQGVLTFSDLLEKSTVGDSWGTWSHDYAGPVWFRDSATSLTLDLPPNTAAFALYLEPTDFGTFHFTVVNNNGKTAECDIEGDSGAQGVAFYVGLGGDTLESITIDTTATAGYAIGEFLISQEPVGFVHDVGLDDGPDHGQLIVTTNVTDIGAIAYSLQYQPMPDYAGLDSFSYRLAVIKTCAGQLVTNIEPATVYVAVGAPDAMDDDLLDLILMGGGDLEIPAARLLENDTPTDQVQVVADGEPVATAQGGSVVWDAETEAFIYTPPSATFNGCDSFEYDIAYLDDYVHLCESAEETDTAMVTVYVRNAPLAIELQTTAMINGGTVSFNLFDLLEAQGVFNMDCTTLQVVDNVQDGEMTYDPNGDISYTPDAHSDEAMDWFMYRLVDCGFPPECGVDVPPMTSEVHRVDILLDWEIQAPIVQNSTVTTLEDHPVTVAVSAQDPQQIQFGYGGIVAYEVAAGSANGSISLAGGNQFQYIPNANWCGTDSFEWRAQNAAGLWSAATVTINVTCVNDPPIANDDSVTLDECTSAVIDVMANDEDVDSDPAGWSILTLNDTAHGTVVVQGQKLLYTPDCCFVGADSFSYMLRDGDGGSDSASVQITVERAKLPTAVSQLISTDEDVAYVGQLAGSNCDGTDLSFAALTGSSVAGGTVTVDADGLFSYQPAADYHNRPGSDSLDSFQFTVTDWFGTSTGTVEIVVQQSIDAHDGTAETDQNRPVDITLDTDALPGTMVGFEIIQPPANGTLVQKNGAVWTYQPDLGFWGEDQFTFKANDGERDSNIATVTITVNPVDVVDGDFDGDGRADLATFRAVDALWNFLYSATDEEANMAYGWWATLPVPGDYDGDGQLDLAVYHPRAGRWYIRPSADGEQRIETATSWAGSVPLPGDYDGDGITDLATFDPSTARWSFRYSMDGSDWGLSFGWSATVPAPADYDADGVTDLAVYHPASGNWYIHQSSLGIVDVVPWGWSSAIPVPADYDGDGAADVAVFHRKTATWYIRYSSGGDRTFAFGWSAVTPVPADYDGDGKADLAVYHEASGNWYIESSDTGVTLVKRLGGPGRIPVRLNVLIHNWFNLP